MDFNYKKLYLNGELVDANSGSRKSIKCPGTGEVIGEIAWADEVDSLKALESAQDAFKSWSRLSLKDREKWMLKLKMALITHENDIRESIRYEMGKTWDGTGEDFETITESLEWYPRAMRKRKAEIIPDEDTSFHHEIIEKPAGVAVAYLAWNFPLLNLGFKLGPALASGCTIILKPSAKAPISAYLLGEILYEIGFPPGVVNILTGDDFNVASTLTKSKIPALVTMIGSTSTGRKVIADSSTSIKKLSMELGGNAPAIVFEDADLPNAVKDISAVKFGNSGQICVAPNRIFVHEMVYNKFLDLFISEAKKIRIGFEYKDNPTMGPLIDKHARNRMMDLVKDAKSLGAKVILGGDIPANSGKGYFFSPTIIVSVKREMRVFREEIFGPIAPIISFKTDDEVLELANDTEYGLSSYIFSNNSERVSRFASDLEFGEVHVNGFKYAIYLPHGGIKESGIGHDCSHLALDDYLVKKRITKKNVADE